MEKIPKIIHYCWFGDNEFTELNKKCIDTWKKFCPDYEFMLWDNDNIDLSSCKYAQQAYEKKHWAFVSDFARFQAINKYGGIYLDVDVELIKSLDDFLGNDCFLSFKDYRSNFGITSGIFGATKKHPYINTIYESYLNRTYIKEDDSVDITPIAKVMYDECAKLGLQLEDKLQEIEGIKVYPCEYLCPHIEDNKSFIVTDKTHSLHYFNTSWLTQEMRETYKKQMMANKDKKVLL